MHRPRASLLVLLGAVLWGTTGTAQALAPASASSLGIGAVRLVMGALALGAFAALRGAIPSKDAWLKGRTILAAVAVAAYQPFFFTAVRLTGVALGTVLAIGSAPIFAGLLDFISERAPPPPRWTAATVLAIAGLAVLLVIPGTVAVDASGLVLALAAGASYATFAFATKGLVHAPNSEGLLAAMFVGAAILNLPILLTDNLQWLLEPLGAGVALHLGLLATALAYFLFTRGLRELPTSHAVTLSLAEPLTAAGLGIFMLGESLSPARVWGGAMVLIALATLSIPSRRGRD